MINKVAVVIDIHLIDIRLREELILKEVVWGENELELEAKVLVLAIGRMGAVALPGARGLYSSLLSAAFFSPSSISSNVAGTDPEMMAC